MAGSLPLTLCTCSVFSWIPRGHPVPSAVCSPLLLAQPFRGWRTTDLRTVHFSDVPACSRHPCKLQM